MALTFDQHLLGKYWKNVGQNSNTFGRKCSTGIDTMQHFSQQRKSRMDVGSKSYPIQKKHSNRTNIKFCSTNLLNDWSKDKTFL